MKKSLVVSILANVILAAGVLVLWQRCQTAVNQPVKPVTLSNPQAQPAVSSAIAQKAAPAAPPFRWNQLDAPDYHFYVKNLRAIGCPEATLRAIVTADVHAAFDVRARMLRSRLAKLDVRPWSPQSGSLDLDTKLKNELSALPDEETAEIADLLGFKPKPVVVALAAPDPGADDDQSQDEVSPQVPLMFFNVDPAALGLSDEQQDAIKQLREDFLKKIGGPNQDPNDPAYLARWQQAQPYADGMLQTILGGDVYAKYQVMQMQQMQAQDQGISP